LPHHITQRGNNQQAVFLDADDHAVYLRYLREHSEHFGLAVNAYCLMSNHVHVVATPLEEESLAKAVGRTHFRYTQYFNRRYGRSGHLWQSRFYSCALDERHAVAAVRYVELNPVRAGLAKRAWEYEWSSAAAHVGATDRTRLLDLDAWRKQWEPDQWREMLLGPEDEATTSAVRSGTMRGWPQGSDSFIARLESMVGRRLRSRSVGRPRSAY